MEGERGFFWLLGALASSALWYAVGSPEAWVLVIVESVFINEGVRFLLWFVYARATQQQKFDSQNIRTPIKEELSLGAGMAAGRALIMCGSIIWEARGPGSFYLPSCRLLPLFLTASITTALVSSMDVLWTVIAFEGYRTRAWLKIAFVLVAHTGSGSLSLLHTWEGPLLCWIAFAGQLTILVISSYIALRAFREQLERSANKKR